MTRTVVFVHGWSVRSTDTYGRLPERLAREAAARGLSLDVRHVWLTKYVSFRDEVTVGDIARAFEAAVRSELRDLTSRRQRFACVTHSTGGPVVRAWWQRHYLGRRRRCPMSHLVMLAPANFGSALAQLGKGRLVRIKTWFQGVEPGRGVLDWLELGSPESWALNEAWIESPQNTIEAARVFPFVLTGQGIDRRLYDHVNAYTGEPGSDGVVRSAAANLNATIVRLRQADTSRLEVARIRAAPATAFKVLVDRAHSGRARGIMQSVTEAGEPNPAVDALLRCLTVTSARSYDALRAAFADENDAEPGLQRHSMLVFRVADAEGRTVGRFDLKLTAAPANRPSAPASPDRLPRGFFEDRQQNRRHPGTLTYYLNTDVMMQASKLGLRIEPHLDRGFVHFVTAALDASPDVLKTVVRPNETTLVDVVMRRVVREGLVRLEPLSERSNRDFTNQAAGDPLPDEALRQT